MGLRDKIIKDRGNSSNTSSEKKKVIITAPTAEEEVIRQQKASAKPNTVVTKEQYAELMDLYKKGEEANAKNPGKKNPETEAFQKKYHEYLGDEAQRIISADPQKTAKGKQEGLAWYDLKSNEDGIFGRRTKQYLEGLQKFKPADAGPEIAPLPPLKDDTKQPEGPVQDNVIVSHGDPYKERRLPPVAPAWWLQDKIKSLNAGLNYMGIKAYNPWEAQATYMTPRTTYLSPERALAENQSQMNMAMSALAQFNGPQQFNARMKDVSGKGFANAANTIADVHNRNIQMFNQNSAQEANIKNTEARERAASATSMWDKYQTVRQNFDTAKANARNVLVDTVNQGITNRANTYNLNQMNPQFAINPGQGGTMYFHDGRDLKPSQSPTALSDKFASKLADPRFKAMANSDQGRSILWKMTQDEAGINSNDDYMAEYQRSRQRGASNQTPTPGGYPT